MTRFLTKAQAVLPSLLLATSPAWACPVCRPKVQAAIYNQHYLATALLVLLPVLLLAAGGVGLYFSSRLALWKTNLPRPLPASVRPC
ncbi:MAG: hypothetical protein ACRYFZ_20885 [Janthinobacterium lividum]